MGNYVDLVTGYAFKSAKYNNNKGIKLVRGDNITEGKLRWGIKTKYWNELSEELERYYLVEGDILISMDGSKVGKNYAQISESDLPLLLVQRVACLRVKNELLQDYLFIIISSTRFKKYIDLIKTGTTIPHISGSQIKEFTFLLPTIKRQRISIFFLKTMQKKIELNHQMNDTLEKMAQTIFKSWFVDFEPFRDPEHEWYVGEDGFEYNEELEKEIPKEWDVCPIGDIAEIMRGFSYKGVEKFDTPNDYIFITLKSVLEGGGFREANAWLKSERLKERHYVYENDIIIPNTEQTKDGRLLGFPAFVVLPNDYDKEKAVFSHHITRIRANDETLKYYLFYYLWFTQPDTVRFHTGTTVWGLDAKGMSKFKYILVPSKEVIGKFNTVVKPMNDKRHENYKQNKILTSLRDLLLPQLISGKLRIPDPEKFLEDL